MKKLIFLLVFGCLNLSNSFAQRACHIFNPDITTVNSEIRSILNHRGYNWGPNSESSGLWQEQYMYWYEIITEQFDHLLNLIQNCGEQGTRNRYQGKSACLCNSTDREAISFQLSQFINDLQFYETRFAMEGFRFQNLFYTTERNESAKQVIHFNRRWSQRLGIEQVRCYRGRKHGRFGLYRARCFLVY